MSTDQVSIKLPVDCDNSGLSFGLMLALEANGMAVRARDPRPQGEHADQGKTPEAVTTA